MRRCALALLTTVALASGCGGDSGDPLDEALSYLPKDAPLVITVSTDVEGDQYKAARRMFDKLPFAGQVKQSVEEDLKEEELDYENDIKPLLGNEFVVGAASVEAIDEDRFTGAWRVEDEGKLQDLIEKDQEMKEIGEASGATLYQSEGDDFLAVKEDMLVIADSREDLEAAVERAGGEETLSSEQLDQALTDLPDDPLFRVFGDLRALLASPEAAEARKVKWVAALETFGVTGTVSDEEVAFQYSVRTNPEGLTDEDLPIAAGEESPALIVREGESASGLRDPSQMFEFGERAAEAVDPEGYADYQDTKEKFGRQLGIDIDRDVVQQLAGDVVSTQTADQQFGVRAELRDPQAFEATLAKVADQLPELLSGAGAENLAVVKPKGGQQFYAVSSPQEGERAVFGVINGALVVASDAERAAAIGAASPEPVEGLKGAAVSTANAGALAQGILNQAGTEPELQGLAGSFFTRSLGDVRSQLQGDTSGLRGDVRLEIK